MAWLRSLLSEGTQDSLMRVLVLLLVVNGIAVIWLGVILNKDTLSIGCSLIGFGIGGKLGQKPFESK